MRLGEKVLALLESSGKRKKDLAEKLGTNSTTIIGWEKENRNPSSAMIVPICEFFGITPNELFDFDATTAGLDEEEQELLIMFRGLDRKGRRAVLHEADVQEDRIRFEGDNANTAM